MVAMPEFIGAGRGEGADARMGHTERLRSDTAAKLGALTDNHFWPPLLANQEEIRDEGRRVDAIKACSTIQYDRSAKGCAVTPGKRAGKL